MDFRITCDSNSETKVDKVLDSLSDVGYVGFFKEQNYGNSLDAIFLVLMCRDPQYNFKQRIRLAKKEKCLYMDIMLDYKQFIKIDQKERERIVVGKLIAEIAPIIRKYKFEDFDLLRFEADLITWVKKIIQ